MPEKVTVIVDEGKVCGFKTKTLYSRTDYYTFFGIPYGQSTAGSARFKDPVKVKPWNNLLDATVEKGGCIQFSLKEKNIAGSEDCLYNNIYTAKIPSKGDVLKAVMVNIHPGGVFHGSPDRSYYGAPDFFMNQDIVYVSVGFRLHLLGFLNMHKKVCSGNQGLKDIILSLQWIKKNISVFGGDPENITVMGSSSGASLVHLLLLSPLAKGLYHKAILMGPSVFSPMVIFLRENVSLAYEFGQKIGYEGNPDEHAKLLNFYKNLGFVRLFMGRPEQFFSKTTLQVFPTSPFGPTPEPGDNSPLPTSFEKLIPTTNRVPVMIGFCEREACMAIALLRTLNRSIDDSFRTAFRQNPFSWGADLSEDDLKLIQKEVEDFYLNGDPIQSASKPLLCDILTDVSLSDIYDSLIDVISADLPESVYVYNFFYDGKLCSMKAKLEALVANELKGAFHSADFSYWNYAEETAGKSMGNIQPNDRQTIDTLTRMLTTFAKTSNPNYEGINVEWKPTTPENPSHLIIDETLQVKDELLNGERMKFWHKLKKKFNKEREDS